MAVINLDVNNVMITVQIDDPPSQPPSLIRLNLTENLSNIRKELETDDIINNTLSFSRKIPSNNNYNLAEILHEREENFLLKEIIKVIKVGSNESHNILYLIKNSRPDWKFLNEKCKLDFGHTMTFGGIKKADERAFIMKDCELNLIGAEGCYKGNVGFSSEGDWLMKKNLFFTTDVNVQEFVKLGLSVGISKGKNFKYEEYSSYHFTEYGKLSLKYKDHLKPTEEFIKDVKDAIKSKKPEEFKK